MTKNKYHTTTMLTLALTGILLAACSGGKDTKPRPSEPTEAAKYDIDRKYEHYTALAESIEKALLDDNIDGDEVETISGHYRDYKTEIGNILRRAKKNNVYKIYVSNYQKNHPMKGVISWQQDIEKPLKENNVYGLAIRKTQMEMIEEDPKKFGFLKDDL